MTFNMKEISAVMAGLISSIALLGWWIDHAALASWLPGIANMTFNTAISFLLMAIACCMPDGLKQNDPMPQNKTLSKQRSSCNTSRIWLAGAVALLAGLSLTQDLLGVHLGIDNLLFDTRASHLDILYPGRMSPLTALGFLLCAGILILLGRDKQQNLSTLTHGLILALAMLALSGIGMAVLMQDVPEAYAHIASISLFTAISFLLLTIALLHIFQSQRESNTDLLLYSGIRLMYKLKYPQKFALISAVFTIPLGMLMWDELEQHQTQVAQAKLKLIGIRHIQETNKLIKVIPEHRGMSYAHFSNPSAFATSLTAKTKEVDRLFAENAIMDHLHADSVDVPDEWPGVLARWRKIKNNPTNALESWRLHTEMIALLNKHLRDVGKQTLLAYDPDPAVHNMLTLEIQQIPKLIEQLGQLRGQGASFMARKAITHPEMIMLGSMTSNIQLLLDESKQLFTSYSAGSQFKPIRLEFSTFTTASQLFISTTEHQLIRNARFTISAEDYFALGTSAIRDGFEFSANNLSNIEQLLHNRINASMTAQYNIKLMAMIVVLMLLFLFAAFYRSVMNTISALDEVSEQMRRGDMDKLSHIPSSDEMGEIVTSFNAIAETLIQTNSQMRTIVDHAVDGIITIDPHGIIHSFNPASETIFGFSADEIIGQNIERLMPEAYRARHHAGLERYRNTGKGGVIGQSMMVSGLKKCGDEFPMELSLNTMSIDGNLMFIGMIHDRSKNIELENQLRHAQKMEAVGALVGGVAHNFNNLLAGIVGKTFLAKRKSLHNPDVLPYLESVESICAQAGGMIKQLLTFAHKDFFRDQQDMSLDLLIKETFKTASLGIPADIKLELQLIDTDIMVHCDANQVQQVLMNMMNNARDAVADKHDQQHDQQIVVRLEANRPDAAFFERHKELNAGEYACLSITDNGCGMNTEAMTKIFDPFYTTKEVGKGTGLGLSTAFGTITSHLGVIEVDSQTGQGTAFRIYLPVIKASKIHSPYDDQQHAVRSNRHETLLLVDDEPLLLHSMKEVLEDLGYNVIKAKDGAQGLKKFHKYGARIDAIITDVVMPGMSGVDMFLQIRAINSQIPTIFMTGYNQDSIHLNAADKTNSLIISKPAQIPELSHQIQTILKQAKSATLGGY